MQEEQINKIYMVVNLFDRPIGTLVSYQEIMELTGKALPLARNYIYPAITILEKEAGKTATCSRKEGYVISPAKLVIEGVKKRQRKSQNQVNKAQHTASCVDQAKWTQQEKEGLALEVMKLNRIAQAHDAQIRKLKENQQKQTEINRFTQTKYSQMEAWQVRLEERLNRIEGQLGGQAVVS